MSSDATKVRDGAPGHGAQLDAQEVPPGYKRTEIGVMPEDWRIERTTNFGKVVTGGTPSTVVSRYWNGTYPWVTPTDISESRDISSTDRQLTDEGLKAIRELPPNTVLVTCIASIGKNAILRLRGGCNQQINAVIPDSKHCPEFLYYLFGSATDRMLRDAGTTATSILSKARFSQLQFAVPPLAEQRAIAEALSDVDELLAALEALIAKKRAIKQAAMQQLLTGKTRLPGFSGTWEKHRLADLADFRAGTYLPQAMYTEGAYDVQGAGGLMGRFDIANIPSSLSVIGRVGTVGKPRFYPAGCWVNNNAGAIVARNTSVPEFVHLLLVSMDWSNVVSVTAQPFLVVPDLMNVRFMVPHRDEQRAIAKVLSDMDAEIAALEARRDKTRAIKQGMMQQLLTGRVRLV